MKNIDIKSIIIGALLTSTIFLGGAAVPKDTGKTALRNQSRTIDWWDDNQQWDVKTDDEIGKPYTGYEPFGYSSSSRAVIYRKRIK